MHLGFFFQNYSDNDPTTSHELRKRAGFLVCKGRAERTTDDVREISVLGGSKEPLLVGSVLCLGDGLDGFAHQPCTPSHQHHLLLTGHGCLALQQACMHASVLLPAQSQFSNSSSPVRKSLSHFSLFQGKKKQVHITLRKGRMNIKKDLNQY